MEKMKILRQKIDKIDEDIIKNLSERKKIALQIGQLKAESGQPILDLTREAQKKIQYGKLCLTYGLEEKFIQRLFGLIIAYSRKLQK